MIFARFLDRRTRREKAPRPPSFAAHTPLERLPMVAIDCETTGLDWRRDRLVSFAAVPIESGLRVAPQPSLDVLVNPGVPVPGRASAIHGIHDSDVAGAPSFGNAFDGIMASLESAVVIGHDVHFDLALIGREAARAQRAWREPPSLDTALLGAGLGLPTHHLDLMEILTELGVEPRGLRHTALGDAHMAADLFVALAHRLIGRGNGTFGGAVAAQRSRRP